jgi:carbonic anhydrase
MSAIDEYLANNARYAKAQRPAADATVLPNRRGRLHDARLNASGALLGSATARRTSSATLCGSSPTTIRSLAISQRLLGTREALDPPHRLRMLTFTDDALAPIHERDRDQAALGRRVLPGPDEDVRQSIARIKASPFCAAHRRRPRLRSTSPPASSTRSADR